MSFDDKISDSVKILIVEDNPADLRILTEYIMNDPPVTFDITHASTLNDMLNILQADVYGVVLLDLDLPDSTGLEGLEIMSTLKSMPPVIVMTEIDSEGMGLLALSRYAQDYIVKGKINRENLIRIIRYAIERHKADEAMRCLNTELEQRTADLEDVNEILRDSRRAALNLMEDAIEARHEAINEKNRLEAVMEALPIGVVIMDETGGNARANRMFDEIWGGPCQAVQSIFDTTMYKAWWSDTGRPVQPDEWASAIAMRKGETVVGQTMRIARFDGAGAYIQISAAPILNSDGLIAGGAMAIQDITNRYENEKALRISEARYRSLMELSPSAIVVIRGERIAMLNPSALDLFGAEKAGQILGKTILEVFHPDCRTIIGDKLRQMKKGRNLLLEEQIIVQMDGSMRNAELSAAPFIDSEGPGIQIVLRDITMRKQAEEAQRKAEEQLRREFYINAALAELSEALISSNMTIQQISEKVFVCAMELTGSSHGFSAFIDSNTLESVSYQLTAMMGSDRAIAGPDKRVSLPPEPDGRYPGLWGHALNTRVSFYDNDVQKNPSVRGARQGKGAFNKFLCVPALAGGNLLGCIALADPRGNFGDKEIEVVKRIAALYALSIQRLNYENAIEEMNRSLEEKVRDRSMQLNLLNEKLKQEIEERKKSAEDLKRSELKFRTVADFTYAAEYWVDVRGDYVYVSPSTERVTGYRSEEFMADKNLLFNIIYPEDCGVFSEHVKHETRDMCHMEIDFRIIRKDGVVRYISHECNPVYDEFGEFIGRRASNRDVTVQRQAEIKLREGEEVARALINTPTEPVLLTGTDGTIIDANDEIVRRLNTRRDKIVGTSMFDLIGEEMMPLRRKKIKEVLNSGKALRFVEKSGDSWFDTIIFPIRNHDGVINKMAVFSHDITETRRMHKEILKISELERQRIGQDLHDSLGQKLTGIAFLSESLNQTMLKKSYPEQAGMEEIVMLVMDSIKNARNISKGLWGMMFESNNASKVLADLAHETQNFYGIRCVLHDTLSEPINNNMVATTLYFIAKESIINSIKHGKSDLIDISFKDDDESIFLEMLDNGSGAVKDYLKTKGIGIHIMQHRAEIIGGKIHAGSLKKGFRVLVTLNKEFIKIYLS